MSSILFAVQHDSQRDDDGRNEGHGARAADFVDALNGDLFHLDSAGLDMLIFACRHHRDGYIEADVTIRTCWDADRLDFGRVGIRPHPDRLATVEARSERIIHSAYRRSIGIRTAR